MENILLGSRIPAQRFKFNRRRREYVKILKYGMTQSDWDKMFLDQGEKCAICETSDPGSKSGWSTDHCHARNDVRAILCHGCNIGLGGFKDNLTSLRSAIEYLKSHSMRPARKRVSSLELGGKLLKEMEIRKAAARDRNYRLADGHGLYVLVTPSGGKLFRYKYRFHGLEKLMSFGTYPSVSLSEARDRHDEARRLLAKGIDPMAKRKVEKVESLPVADTFEQVALLWHDHWRAGKSQQHADTIIRRLKRNVFPMLGAHPIASIKTSEVVAMVKAVEERGVADLAKRSLETTGQIFRYAIAHEYTENNPAANIKPRDILKSTPKKNIARVEPKQLPALLRSIEVYRGTHVTRLGMKLMAHTFLRTGELIGGEWSEVDFAAARWDIPKERMKMKTPHIVPLSRQAIEILRLLQQLTGDGKLLFPGDRDPRRPISNNTILFALGRMGYKYTMTGHGFRGLASTILHEHGFDHQHIELQLAHAPRNAVSAAYNHALYLAPRAKMMAWWSNYLEEQLKS